VFFSQFFFSSVFSISSSSESEIFTAVFSLFFNSLVFFSISFSASSEFVLFISVSFSLLFCPVSILAKLLSLALVSSVFFSFSFSSRGVSKITNSSSSKSSTVPSESLLISMSGIIDELSPFLHDGPKLGSLFTQSESKSLAWPSFDDFREDFLSLVAFLHEASEIPLYNSSILLTHRSVSDVLSKLFIALHMSSITWLIISPCFTILPDSISLFLSTCLFSHLLLFLLLETSFVPCKSSTIISQTSVSWL